MSQKIMRFQTSVFVFVFVAVAVDSAWTTTLLAPRDYGELARLSDCVVLAEAGSQGIGNTGGLPCSQTTFLARRVFAGPVLPGDELLVEVEGGISAGRGWLVEGAPRFRSGSTYVLFLRATRDGIWKPMALSLGLLVERATDAGQRFLSPLPEVARLDVLTPADPAARWGRGSFGRDEFLRHLDFVLEGRDAWSLSANLESAEEAGEAARGDGAGGNFECEFFETNAGSPYRWTAFDSHGAATVQIAASSETPLPFGGVQLVSSALNHWVDVASTRINLRFGGIATTTPSCTVELDTERNTILFEDPCGDLTALRDCEGVLAIGGPLVAGTHQFDGSTWGTITGWVMVVNDGAHCLDELDFERMLAHELGHGLGFRHFADTESLMFERCCNDINETDQACLQLSYPAPDANARPRIDFGVEGPLSVFGRELTLAPEVVDDGLPASPGLVTVEWGLLHGPAPVTFSNGSSANTQVVFSASGEYLLGITASDGQLMRHEHVVVEVDIDGAPRFLRGDTSDDGELNLTDAVVSLSHLFASGELACPDAGDANDDGTVNLSDPVMVLNHLFAQGPALATPYATCGVDATSDALEACRAISCRD